MCYKHQQQLEGKLHLDLKHQQLERKLFLDLSLTKQVQVMAQTERLEIPQLLEQASSEQWVPMGPMATTLAAPLAVSVLMASKVTTLAVPLVVSALMASELALETETEPRACSCSCSCSC
jgi:hypothetical protein